MKTFKQFINENSESTIYKDIRFDVIKKKDGRIFYRLNGGDIEVVQKKDGTAYVSIKGEKNGSTVGNYTREVNIEDFNNVEDAKDYAVSQFKKSI